MSVEEQVVATVLPNNLTSHRVVFEHNWQHFTGVYRNALRLDSTPRAKILRSLYGSVVVVSLSAEMRQDCMLGGDDGTVRPTGHMFIGLIPSSRNTDAVSGHDAITVASVPGKHSFPMSAVELKTYTYKFDLTGYELDLAEDPRRGAGIVIWTGNSGLMTNMKGDVPIVSVTWRVEVECSGPSVLW